MVGFYTLEGLFLHRWEGMMVALLSVLQVFQAGP